MVAREPWSLESERGESVRPNEWPVSNNRKRWRRSETEGNQKKKETTAGRWWQWWAVLPHPLGLRQKRDVALIRHRKRSQLLQSTQSSRLVKDRRIAVVPTSSAPRPACLSIVAATETPSSAENRRSWILSIQLEAANDLIVFSIFSFWRLHSAVTLFFSIRHVYSTVDTERTKVNRVDYWIFFLLFLATNKRLLTLVSQKEKERKKGEKDRLGGSCRAMF